MQKILIQNDFVNWNKDSLIQAIKLADYKKEKGKPLNIIEFGVYTGDSIRLATHLLKQLNRQNIIIGVDSFEGLPEESANIDRYEHYKKGGFGDVYTKPHGYENAILIKKWFKDLVLSDVSAYGINKFDIVHMDCDLHISTIDAYTFLLDNKLIDNNTIITYDEFKSTKQLYSGGESLAHKEIANKYLIDFEEIFRNEYWDELNQLNFWQNTFLINSIGVKANCGLIEINNNK